MTASQRRARDRARNRRHPHFYLTDKACKLLQILKDGKVKTVEQAMKKAKVDHRLFARWQSKPRFRRFFDDVIANFLRVQRANKALLTKPALRVLARAITPGKNPPTPQELKASSDATRTIQADLKEFIPPKVEKKPRLVHPSVPKEKVDSILKQIHDDD